MEWHCVCCGAFMDYNRSSMLDGSTLTCPRGCTVLNIAPNAGYAWNIEGFGGETVIFNHNESRRREIYQRIARLALDYRQRHRITFRLETEEDQFIQQLNHEGWA